MVLDNILSLRDEAGKFTKAQAYYAEDTKFQGVARCGNCEFYDGENNKCDLVSEAGDPGPGYISRQGSCTLFNARPARIVLLQMLWGRSNSDGLAPETMRATTYMFTYAGLGQEPPQDLKDKALIKFEDAKSLLG